MHHSSQTLQGLLISLKGKATYLGGPGLPWSVHSPPPLVHGFLLLLCSLSFSHKGLLTIPWIRTFLLAVLCLERRNVVHFFKSLLLYHLSHYPNLNSRLTPAWYFVNLLLDCLPKQNGSSSEGKGFCWFCSCCFPSTWNWIQAQ